MSIQLPCAEPVSSGAVSGPLVELLAGLEPALGRPIHLPRAVWPMWGLDDAREVELWLLGVIDATRILLLVGDDVDPKAIADQAWRERPGDEVVWVWQRGPAWFFGFMEELGAQRARFRVIEFSLTEPARGEELARELLSAPFAQLGQVWRGSRRREVLIKRFFKAFVKWRDRLAAELLSGPEDEAARQALALTILLRLIVLYFLQIRGALDQNPRYISEAFSAARCSGASFWKAVLQPLFFGALNREIARRDDAALALGAIPFLNGGLFEPTRVELAHPELELPDHVFFGVLAELFEPFQFTLAREGARGDAIDPHVLGAVFEGVMNPARRQRTGTYYTPTHIVQRVLDGCLVEVLSERSGLPNAMIAELVRDGDVELSSADARALADAARGLTVLDPAVGTGAFLIEALHALSRVWRAVRRARPDLDVPDPDTYSGRRELVHAHLYGVDLSAEAIQLCELRLWLGLLELLPSFNAESVARVEPLPNLSHRVTVGDSLVDPLEVRGLRVAGELASWSRLDRDQLAGHAQRLSGAQRRYLLAHGEQKRAARAELEEVQRGIFARMIEDRLERVEQKLGELDRVACALDLFGHPVGDDALASKQRAALERRRVDLSDQLARGAAGEALGFSYEVRFAEVMARGGFDVVVMNPPWVRAEAQAPELKALYKSRYRAAANELWEGAADAGVCATFGTQVDLSALFLERGLELVHPDGCCGALVPAKLFRSLHGAPLRRILARHSVLEIEDYSDASAAMFDAATYPFIAIVRPSQRASAIRRAPGRRTPRRRQAAVTVWSQRACTRWTCDPRSLSTTPGAPWVLSPPDLDDVLEVLNRARCLGQIEQLRPRRGVLTGCNAAFISREATMAALLADSPDLLDTWTRRVISGKDLRAWRAAGADRIIWPYHDGGELADFSELPEPLRRHLRAHEERLRARADFKGGDAFWRLFRVQPGLELPKVAWRDMSPMLEAALVAPGAIPLNTTYYIPCADEARAWGLAALLNSASVRALTWLRAERARGGWRRHFGWVVAMTPVPGRWRAWLGGEPDAELARACMTWRAEGAEEGARLASLSISRAFGLSEHQARELEERWMFHVKHPAREVA